MAVGWADCNCRPASTAGSSGDGFRSHSGHRQKPKRDHCGLETPAASRQLWRRSCKQKIQTSWSAGVHRRDESRFQSSPKQQFARKKARNKSYVNQFSQLCRARLQKLLIIQTLDSEFEFKMARWLPSGEGKPHV
jgi:hypothetical protein